MADKKVICGKKKVSMEMNRFWLLFRLEMSSTKRDNRENKQTSLVRSAN